MGNSTPCNLRHRSAMIGLALAAVLGPTLGACTVAAKPPEPNAAAAALAAGLGSADLSKVVFDGAAPADATAFVTTAIGELKDVKRTVTVAKITRTPGNDAAAKASLGIRVSGRIGGPRR